MSYKIVYHDAHPDEREIGDHVHIFFSGSPEEIRESRRILEEKLDVSLKRIARDTFDHGRNYQIDREVWSSLSTNSLPNEKGVSTA